VSPDSVDSADSGALPHNSAQPHNAGAGYDAAAPPNFNEAYTVVVIVLSCAH